MFPSFTYVQDRLLITVTAHVFHMRKTGIDMQVVSRTAMCTYCGLSKACRYDNANSEKPTKDRTVHFSAFQAEVNYKTYEDFVAGYRYLYQYLPG